MLGLEKEKEKEEEGNKNRRSFASFDPSNIHSVLQNGSTYLHSLPREGYGTQLCSALTHTKIAQSKALDFYIYSMNRFDKIPYETTYLQLHPDLWSTLGVG